MNIISIMLSLLLYMSLHATNAQASSFGKLLDYVLEESEGKSTLEQALVVNRIINNYTYQSDSKLYYSKDYWAKPDEFINNRGGDCEDFAIIKQKLLQSLGIDSSLVQFRKDGTNHIAVVALLDQQFLLLDLDNETITLNSQTIRKLRFFHLAEIENGLQTSFQQTPTLQIQNGLPSALNTR